MVNFIQKNAAKIVIIAGAALISSIGGGCKCDPQNSTKSQKCTDATTKHGAECAKNSSGKVATTNKNLLCKTDKCDAKDFNYKDGACCEKKGNCGDVFQVSTGNADDKEKCGAGKELSTEYKCDGDCDTKNDKALCCVAPKSDPTPACTKGKSDAACKVTKCSENNPVRVFLGDELCKPLCKKTDGSARTDGECACAHSVNEKGANFTTCLVGQTCTVLKAGSKGVCALPECGKIAVGEYYSNCLYTPAGKTEKKTCHGFYHDDSKTCIYTTIKEGAISSTGKSVCTSLDEPSNEKLADTKDIVFCEGEGKLCKLNGAALNTCTDAPVTQCADTGDTNCEIVVHGYKHVCGTIGNEQYYYTKKANVNDKICVPKCATTGNTTDNTADCMCVGSSGKNLVELTGLKKKCATNGKTSA